jgi:hypothetical protein
MLGRCRIGALTCGALAVVGLLCTAAPEAASAADTAATAAPALGKVRAKLQTAKGPRTTWLLTASAVDRDGDLVRGQVRIKIGAKGKVLSRRISGARSRSTSVRAAVAAQGIRSATLARRTLKVVFYADVAPGPLNVTFWVLDARRHSSKRVVLRLTVKANQTVSIAATDPSASEPSTPGAFTITRTGGGTAMPLTVAYTVSGTATSSDFTALPGTVTIPKGKTSTTIAVTPADDETIESTETVVVTITPQPAYIVGTANTATVEITSDDLLPTVSVTASDPAAAEPASPGSFRISRTGRTTASLSISYSVTGTATTGTDFTTLTGTVTIPAGATFGTLTVTPINDTVIESPETVIVTLQASTRYTVGTPSTATVTITDDDVLPTVAVTATDAAASEPAATGTFTVTRTGSTTAALTVGYTLGGSATSSDYTAAPASPLTIPAGATSATITVTPTDDSLVEEEETVEITLSDGTNYDIGSPSTATVNIADNEPSEPVVTIEATDAAAAETTPPESENPGTFTVTRTGNTTASLDVFYTVTGTATNGADFDVLTGRVTIPAGQASATITIGPMNDSDIEGPVPETVILTLVDADGYSVGTTTTDTVEIADND